MNKPHETRSLSVKSRYIKEVQGCLTASESRESPESRGGRGAQCLMVLLATRTTAYSEAKRRRSLAAENCRNWPSCS